MKGKIPVLILVLVIAILGISYFVYENSGSKLFYPDGKTVKYKGDLVNNLPEGNGKFYFENGKVLLKGSFKNGMIIKGKQYYDNGKMMYEGDFSNGAFVGKGKAFTMNGKKWFEGDFKDGKPNGNGKMYDGDGKLMYEGYFENGQFIRGK